MVERTGQKKQGDEVSYLTTLKPDHAQPHPDLYMLNNPYMYLGTMTHTNH